METVSLRWRIVFWSAVYVLSYMAMAMLLVTR